MLLAAAGGTRVTNGASQGAGRGYNGSSTCAVDVFAKRPVGRIDGRKRRLGNPIEKYNPLSQKMNLKIQRFSNGSYNSLFHHLKILAQ
jgi:hypothetical protein